MPRYPVHHESLLDLFRQQQNRGEQGLRWGLHQDLLAHVKFQDAPYRFCAVSGRPELAALLHRRGVPFSGSVTAAYFTSGGVNGNTSWSKSLSFSPEEMALMAGHQDTADVLRNIGRGIPMDWSRENHCKYPEEFKVECRNLVEDLAAEQWFHALPGTARCLVIDKLAADRARDRYWSTLSESIWQPHCEHLVLGPDLSPEGLDRLMQRWAVVPKETRVPTQIPQYHVRFSTGHAVARRLCRWPRVLFRAATAAASVAIARKNGMRLITGNIALAVGVSQAPAPFIFLLAMLVIPKVE